MGLVVKVAAGVAVGVLAALAAVVALVWWAGADARDAREIVRPYPCSFLRMLADDATLEPVLSDAAAAEHADRC